MPTGTEFHPVRFVDDDRVGPRNNQIWVTEAMRRPERAAMVNEAGYQMALVIRRVMEVAPEGVLPEGLQMRLGRMAVNLKNGKIEETKLMPAASAREVYPRNFFVVKGLVRNGEEPVGISSLVMGDIEDSDEVKGDRKPGSIHVVEAKRIKGADSNSWAIRVRTRGEEGRQERWNISYRHKEGEAGAVCQVVKKGEWKRSDGENWISTNSKWVKRGVEPMAVTPTALPAEMVEARAVNL